MLVPLNDPFVGVIQLDVDDESIRTFLSSLVNSQAMRFQPEYVNDKVTRLRRRIMEDSPRMTPEQHADYTERHRIEAEQEIERRVEERVAAEKKRLSEAERAKRRG